MAVHFKAVVDTALGLAARCYLSEWLSASKNCFLRYTRLMVLIFQRGEAYCIVINNYFSRGGVTVIVLDFETKGLEFRTPLWRHWCYSGMGSEIAKCYFAPTKSLV